MQERCCALIDLNAAENNYAYLRSRVHGAVKFLCVVKADAYGHGAVEMSRLWEHMGADMLAVACAEEAIRLRDGGVYTPCLVLGYAPPTMVGEFHRRHILPTVYSVDEAIAFDHAAEAVGCILSCHIKINTGMNRLGIPHHDTAALKKICTLSHLNPCGIYSHFSSADSNPHETDKQLNRFTETAAIAEGICGHVLTRHIANTEAILRSKHTHLDMVRAGIGLYGYTSCPNTPIKPVMRLHARINQIHEVKRGDIIGYQPAYRSHHTTRIAVISAGYADGIRRDSAEHHLMVDICGVSCPLIGSVCMDMCMADIGHIKGEVSAGDAAIFFGTKNIGGADEIASRLGTIPYEILTSVSHRPKRIYARI